LDVFLREVLAGRDEDTLFILTSDHGNIENLGTRGHTMNNVPLVAIGPRAEEITKGATSLIDVMPNLLRVL
jgi:phosphopentomutase